MKKINDLKKEYDEISVPNDLLDKVKLSIQQGKSATPSNSKTFYIKRIGLTVAAMVGILIILPNTTYPIANAMSKIPILGNLIDVFTVRDYQVDEDRYHADVNVPQLALDETNPSVSEETKKQLEESAKDINLDIQKLTDQLIDEFKANMDMDGGYEDIMVKSNVVTNNDKWFSLNLSIFQAAGSGYEQHKFYTINKQTGKQFTLADLFKPDSDYKTIISDEIKKQMREQMAANKDVTYFLDSKEMPEWDFKEISDNQNFYINSKEQLVIAFDEYEVAPGAMGALQFVIPTDVIQNILVEPLS